MIVYVSFSAEININTTEQLLGAVFDQVNAGATGIYLLLSTPGGFVDQGVNAYNVLNGLPVPLTTHNTGHVDSVGNAVFLAGKHRVACPHATFMFHGVSWDFPEPTRMDGKKARETLDSIQVSQDRIAGIVRDETSLECEEINGLFLEAQTKDTAFACKKGIIQKVAPVSIPAGAPLIQLVFQRS